MSAVLEPFAQTLAKDFVQSAVKAIGGKAGGAIADAVLGAIGIGGDSATQQALQEINSKLDNMENQLEAIQSELNTQFALLVSMTTYGIWNSQNSTLQDTAIDYLDGYWLAMGTQQGEPTASSWVSDVKNSAQGHMDTIHKNVMGSSAGSAVTLLDLYVSVLADGINQGKFPGPNPMLPSSVPVQSYINYYASLATWQLKAAIMLKVAYLIGDGTDGGDPTAADTVFAEYVSNIQAEQQAFISGLTNLLMSLYGDNAFTAGQSLQGQEAGDDFFNGFERDVFCLPELIGWAGPDKLLGYVYETAEGTISSFLPAKPGTQQPGARIAVYQVQGLPPASADAKYYTPNLVTDGGQPIPPDENFTVDLTVFDPWEVRKSVEAHDSLTISRANFWVNAGQTYWLQNHDDTVSSSDGQVSYFQGYEQYVEGGAGITVSSQTSLAVVRFTPYVNFQ